MRRAATLLGCLALLSPTDVRAQPGADVVLRGGKIWTVNKEQPEAKALAIQGGRIIAVGSDEAIRPYVGPRTKVIDLAGRRVVPGFHDSHVHVLNAGRLL